MKGLTLIELMVSLVVATIVMVVGVPSYKNIITNQHSTTAVNELVTALNLARSSAVKTSRHVSLCRSADGQTCDTGSGSWHHGWIVFVNNSFSDASTRTSDEELLRVYPQLDGGISFVSTGAIANYVSFRPTGDTDVAGTWTYCDVRGIAQAKAVVIMRSGRSLVSELAVDGSPLQCESL